MSVILEPSSQLNFHRPLTQVTKEILLVANPGNDPIMFKIKTTAPKQYCVRPNAGRVAPNSQVEVQVILQPFKEEPPLDYKCKDKFLVQTAIIKPAYEALAVSDMWSRVEAEDKAGIFQQKIKCSFLESEGGATIFDDHERDVYRNSDVSVPPPYSSSKPDTDGVSTGTHDSHQGAASGPASASGPAPAPAPQQFMSTELPSQPEPSDSVAPAPAVQRALEPEPEPVAQEPKEEREAPEPIHVTSPPPPQPAPRAATPPPPPPSSAPAQQAEVPEPPVVETKKQPEPEASVAATSPTVHEAPAPAASAASAPVAPVVPAPQQAVPVPVDDSENKKLRQDLLAARELIERLEKQVAVLQKEKEAGGASRKLPPTVQPQDAVHQHLAALEKPHATEGYPPQVMLIVASLVFVFTYLFF